MWEKREGWLQGFGLSRQKGAIVIDGVEFSGVVWFCTFEKPMWVLDGDVG